MSLCPNCTPWCATTEKQLANRLKNMDAPAARPFECPVCCGVEWATTDKMISATPPSRLRKFIERVFSNG